MNDVGIIALGMFAAIAPFGALRPIIGYANHEPGEGVVRGSFIWISGLIGAALFAIAVLLADPFLEFLDVSPESFRFAAGAVMGPFAVRLLWTGESMPLPDNSHKHPFEPWLFPAAIPLLAGPASLTAAISYSARFGVGDAVVAAIPVIVISTLLPALSAPICRSLGHAAVSALGRLSGALLVIVAVELVVGGVQSV